MLLPQTKEREYRFKLALRMGLPIFALVLAFILHTLVLNYTTLQPSFYIEAGVLILVSIYFIFYLIYNGFKVKITDDVETVFAREYLYDYLKKELQGKKTYTFLLISVDNLSDINSLYGIKNGDKVLKEVVNFIANYLQKESLENFPIGRIKGGDFLIGLEGNKEEYATLFELLLLKASDFKVENIEVKLSGALTDTQYSKELDYLIEHLFDLQEKNRFHKAKEIEEDINPNELESFVIEAINKRNIVALAQNIYDANNAIVFQECFIKLKTSQNTLLYPKKYMKIINKLGLGVAFDLMVIEEISTHCNFNYYCAVNISPTSLRNEKFLLRVKEIIKETQAKFIFVLSETEYFTHIAKYKNIIKSLQRIGVQFAIDRLGSIHTSFLYLRELDIDIVRFDTYYSNKEKLVEYQDILEGFVVMAHKKSVKTWLKNIENTQSLALVEKLGIEYRQGKLLSPLEEKYNT